MREGWFTPCYLSECQLAWTSPSQPQTAGFPAVPSQPHSSKPNMEKCSSKAATMVHGTHHLLPYHHRHPTTCSHTFPILCSLHILLRNRNSVPHEWTCIVLCKFFLKWMETYFPLERQLSMWKQWPWRYIRHAQNCIAAILALEYEGRNVINSRLFPTVQQSLRPICATWNPIKHTCTHNLWDFNSLAGQDSNKGL